MAGLVISAMVIGISSCSKTGADCFTSTGEVTREARHVDDFDTIIANENVDIVITQDTVNSLEVEAGTNIIPGITTEVANRELTIGNSNRCNWVRSYDKPLKVYVHAKNLRKIYYLSAGNITSTNTISSGTLLVDVWGGCGVIELYVDLYEGKFYEHMGTADMIIHGSAMFSSVVAGDFGLLQLKDMKSDYAYVANSGSNDCYVRADKFLDATISSIGNIYYTGNPDSVHSQIMGTGQVIHY
ncbi:MAG: DUF2807 domain-containing protein [Bacteroidetes bacterium]|nr:DUF2807 domain-containing protein [Bacteroidota bacterium]